MLEAILEGIIYIIVEIIFEIFFKGLYYFIRLIGLATIKIITFNPNSIKDLKKQYMKSYRPFIYGLILILMIAFFIFMKS